MADFWILDILIGLSVLQLALSVGAAWYAYRLSKLIGHLLEWTLLILAFTLLVVKNTMSLLLIPLFTPAQIDALLASIPAVATLASQGVSLASGILLLVGMRGLYMVFMRQTGNGGQPVRVSQPLEIPQ